MPKHNGNALRFAERIAERQRMERVIQSWEVYCTHYLGGRDEFVRILGLMREEVRSGYDPDESRSTLMDGDGRPSK